MKSTRNRLWLAALCLAGASSSQATTIYSIGNATPTSIFYVQGQSFTPNVQGNNGTGTPTPDGGGQVFLQDFTIAFGDPGSEPAFLSIYAFEPTLADAATGASSLAIGAHLGGGLYDFTLGGTIDGLLLDYAVRYYAVLPESANIYDGSGNPYTGGVDMFPMPVGLPTHVTEGFGDFDIGFHATFLAAAAPEPSALVLLGTGFAALVVRRRRVHRG